MGSSAGTQATYQHRANLKQRGRVTKIGTIRVLRDVTQSCATYEFTGWEITTGANTSIIPGRFRVYDDELNKFCLCGHTIPELQKVAAARQRIVDDINRQFNEAIKREIAKVMESAPKLTAPKRRYGWPVS